MHGDAARVIAPILQATQALDEDGDDVATGDCTYDSAHGFDYLSK
jgi:hypothetical protein